MTAAERGRLGSARPSGRVEPERGSWPGHSPDQTNSAPDSMSLASLSVARPDRPRRRVGRRRLAFLKTDLSDRERAVLHSLEDFRFLTTAQLQTIHFTDHATEAAAARICRRVLARLAEPRVLEHLERRVGGVRAGSAANVWRVGPAGDRLLRQARGEGARLRRKEPSARYLDHCLAVADCYLTLLTTSRSGRLELVTTETEPGCWRPYLEAGGSRETLKPDLYAVTAAGDYEDHWFIEVDRGTESLPTLLKKCAQYERYRRTGREQVRTGVFPVVVWLLPDAVRLDRLAAALRAARGLDPELFRLTTPVNFADLIAGGAA